MEACFKAGHLYFKITRYCALELAEHVCKLGLKYRAGYDADSSNSTIFPGVLVPQCRFLSQPSQSSIVKRC
jgi:hypothetical protein